MTRLGIVGAGGIVKFHLDAAIMAGFTPVIICGRDGSSKANDLSQLYPGLEAVQNLDVLFQHDVDALVVAVTPENSLGVLEECLRIDKPILVEKPVSTSLESLRQFSKINSDKVRVGYNRRFYSAVNKFKKEIFKESGVVQVVIPELSTTPHADSIERINAILTNSVHTFDLLSYLFGDIKLENIKRVFNEGLIMSISAQIKGSSGVVGNLSLLFGVPENHSIQFWKSGCSIELKPLEKFNMAKSLKVQLPDATEPVKRYIKVFEDWKADISDSLAKPGFLAQYEDFHRFISGDFTASKLATLQDSLRALEIAHLLIWGSD